MIVIGVAFLSFLFTLLGGVLALRFRERLHLLLGFTAGAVLGVAFFDLLPEAFELGSAFYEPHTVALLAAVGFFAYLVLDRTVFSSLHEGHEHPEGVSRHRGTLGASIFTVHTFIDGVAIGLAFQISAAVGLVVAAAILAHNFSDGLNTVNVILKNDGGRGYALRWLIADAVAPVLGAASTLLFTLPEKSLATMLALFAGFFIYLGASDLIPESHHRHPKLFTTVMTFVGAGLIYAVISLVGHH